MKALNTQTAFSSVKCFVFFLSEQTLLCFNPSVVRDRLTSWVEEALVDLALSSR